MCPIFYITPEHETREVLNLVLLLECCLDLPDASATEKAGWRADLAAAHDRLQALLAPGARAGSSARPGSRMPRLTTGAPPLV
jgi:hypothetical protein